MRWPWQRENPPQPAHYDTTDSYRVEQYGWRVCHPDKHEWEPGSWVMKIGTIMPGCSVKLDMPPSEANPMGWRHINRCRKCGTERPWEPVA